MNHKMRGVFRTLNPGPSINKKSVIIVKETKPSESIVLIKNKHAGLKVVLDKINLNK